LITHDLGVVADLADEVLVMYGGSAVEHAPVREIFYEPQMPYTWGLLASIPQISAKKEQLDPIPGSPPSLLNMPKGCVFAPRCTFKDQVPGDACANNSQTCWQFLQTMKPGAIYLNRSELQFDLNARLAGCSHD
jgi:oligopeptide/dipeptide ABC transporter ATP-binding protein